LQFQKVQTDGRISKIVEVKIMLTVTIILNTKLLPLWHWVEQFLQYLKSFFKKISYFYHNCNQWSLSFKLK